MQPSIPLEILELGKRNQLGEFVRYHHGRTLIGVTRKMGGITFFISLCMAFLVALLFIGLNAAKYEERAVNPIIPFFTLFLLYFFLFGVVPVFPAYFHGGGGQRVYEFADGMIAKRGQKTQLVCHWKDIFALRYISTGNPNANMVGPCLQITAFGGKKDKLFCDTAITRVEQELIRRELPSKLASYEAGETVKFSTISLNKEGITNSLAVKRKKRDQPVKTINWNELQPQMKEQNLVITFTKKADGKPYRLSLYNIENACVLRELLAVITSSISSLQDQQSFPLLHKELSS